VIKIVLGMLSVSYFIAKLEYNYEPEFASSKSIDIDPIQF
jgi:hypothetical protein